MPSAIVNTSLIGAGLPERWSSDMFLRSLAGGQPVDIMPAQIATTPQQKVCPTNRIGLLIRVMQNHGVVPVKYWVKENAPIYASEPPHGVLAACNSMYDGLGSLVDLSRFRQAVWVDNGTTAGLATGFAVGIFLGYTSETNLSTNQDLMATIV